MDSLKVCLLEDERKFNNLAYVARGEKEKFRAVIKTTPSWVPCKKTYFLGSLRNKLILSIQEDENLEKGMLALNEEHCFESNVSAGNIVNLPVFHPKDLFNLSFLRIELDIHPKDSIPTLPISAPVLANEFLSVFEEQFISESQTVLLKFEGKSWLCTALSLHAKGVTGERVPLKQGMILKSTKVTVVVFGLPVIGAEKSKIILRENFSVTSLEEKLLSMGIAGMGRTVMNIIHQAFRTHLVTRARVQRTELKHIRGLLLYGPPGTGKTMIATTLSKLLRTKKLLVVNGPEVFNSLYGESEKKIRALLAAANLDQKAYGDESDMHIIIFDEIDAIAKKRGRSGVSQQEDRVVSQLMTMFDDINHLNNIFVIGTTNREDLLDDALMRHGRMELKFKLGYPDEEARFKILKYFTDKMRRSSPMDDNIDLREVARRTNGCSAAMLSSLVQLAYVKAKGVPDDNVSILENARATTKLTTSHYLLAAETLIAGHQA